MSWKAFISIYYCRYYHYYHYYNCYDYYDYYYCPTRHSAPGMLHRLLTQGICQTQNADTITLLCSKDAIDWPSPECYLPSDFACLGTEWLQLPAQPTGSEWQAYADTCLSTAAADVFSDSLNPKPCLQQRNPETYLQQQHQHALCMACCNATLEHRSAQNESAHGTQQFLEMIGMPQKNLMLQDLRDASCQKPVWQAGVKKYDQ